MFKLLSLTRDIYILQRSSIRISLRQNNRLINNGTFKQIARVNLTNATTVSNLTTMISTPSRMNAHSPVDPEASLTMHVHSLQLSADAATTRRKKERRDEGQSEEREKNRASVSRANIIYEYAKTPGSNVHCTLDHNLGWKMAPHPWGVAEYVVDCARTTSNEHQPPFTSNYYSTRVDSLCIVYFSI